MTLQRRTAGRWMRRTAICLVATTTLIMPAPSAEASPEGDADGAITPTTQASGGDGGSLGPKDGGVYAVGTGFAQNFAGGRIFFTPPTGARIMHGAILDRYESLGGAANSDL